MNERRSAVERISPPRFARDPLLFLGTVLEYNRRSFKFSVVHHAPRMLKVAEQLYGKRRERGARKTLACPAKAREFPGRADHGSLSHSCSSFTLEITAALVQGEGGQNESCWSKVVLLKGGGASEEETRTEIFFSPKRGERAVDYSSEKSISIVRFQIAAMRACVRACETRSLRPGVKQISFLSGVFWGGRDEWEITKERETQLGINEISGDGH